VALEESVRASRPVARAKLLNTNGFPGFIWSGNFPRTIPVVSRSADELVSNRQFYGETLQKLIFEYARTTVYPRYAVLFSKQRSDIGNKVKLIASSTNFYRIAATTDESIHKAFTNIARGITKILSVVLVGQKRRATYESIDTVMNQNDVVSYPTEFSPQR